MATTQPTPTSVQRKLHAWELAHLRLLVAEQQATIQAQAAEIADLKRALSWAEDRADSWRDDMLAMINCAGSTPGLTKDGRVVALQHGAVQ